MCVRGRAHLTGTIGMKIKEKKHKKKMKKSEKRVKKLILSVTVGPFRQRNDANQRVNLKIKRKTRTIIQF